MSATDEAQMDRQRGRLPHIRPDGTSLVFEFAVRGGEMHRPAGWFAPTPSTRLVIRCDRDGEITLRIQERRGAAQ